MVLEVVLGAKNNNITDPQLHPVTIRLAFVQSCLHHLTHSVVPLWIHRLLKATFWIESVPNILDILY